jgi:hypothetical protein
MPLAPASSTPSLGLARAARGLCEPADDVADLLDGQRPTPEPVHRLRVARRPEPRVVAEAGEDPLTPCEDELGEVAAVVLVDAPAELAPERNPLVAVQVRVPGDDVAAFVDGRVGGDDRAHAPAGEPLVPGDPNVGAGPVVVVEAARDARAHDAVLERQPAELQRLEDNGRAHGRTVRLRPPMKGSLLDGGVLTRPRL